ncbi:MAG: PAS domain S-box protein [Acidobacteria bacterium]|nr:PAS domain S-box protein [Acidobacteriota bacterium]
MHKQTIAGKTLATGLRHHREHRSWSWETISQELERAMGQTAPPPTSVFGYSTGEVERPNVLVERYIQEAINKRRIDSIQEPPSQSQIHFSELVENARDLIFRYRLAHPQGFEYMSPVVQEMLGYTPEDFYADPGLIHKLIHPQDRQRLEQALQGKGPHHERATLRWVHRNGGMLWIQWVNVPIYDESGNRVAIEGIARDITSQVEAEATAIHLAAIVKSSHDAIISTAPDGSIVSWNAAAEQLFGYTAQEVIGRSAAILRPGYQEGQYSEIFERLIKGERLEYSDTVGVCKNGQRVHLSVNISPIRNNEGQLIGFSAIARDIIERKWAEEKSRKSQERYHQLFENAPDMMAVISYPDGEVLECNQTLVDEVGLSKPEIVGRSWLKLYPSDSRETAQETFTTYVQTGKLPWKERTLLRADGSSFPALVQVMPIRDEAGKIVATHVTWRDISDLKQTQQALEQKERELFASQKMEAIGTLAGGIAHDFNNLLTGIRGYAQLLQEKLEPASPQSKDVIEILACSDRAAALTAHLLAFSRRQLFDPIVLHLNSVIENTCKMLERLIGEDINLNFVAATNRDNIRADSGYIEQVLMNLAINASDAMPDGGTLTITTSQVKVEQNTVKNDTTLEAGRYVSLVVNDTGCGMDQATQHRIFEPFFTTKDVGDGTGLGLSTVYGIVKQHHGYIWVDSQPGEGSTFTIYLPSTDQEVENLAQEIKQEGTPKGSEVILVAEDEEPVREILDRVLKELGYTVLCASHAQEAEALLLKHNGEIDLLLSDVIMPGRSGPALYRRLKDKRPSLRVLYMSGYAETMFGSLDPCAPFLSKPFTHEILAQKVREVLDGKKVEAGP